MYSIVPFGERSPRIADDVFLADGARIVGDVEIGSASSVWFNAVVRGDTDHVRIGSGTSIQDGCVIHTQNGFPAIVGDRVTVGHMALLHGCTVEDGALIGMASTVLNGAVIGKGAAVAAGAVVTEGMIVPPGMLAMGVPAKVVGPISEKVERFLSASADAYIQMASIYRNQRH